jgi:hypothetical protein
MERDHDWVGMTRAGRINISIEEPNRGHPVPEVVDHERSHANLQLWTMVGWMLHALSIVSAYPWPPGQVRTRAAALTDRLVKSMRYTHESVATFVAWVHRAEGTDRVDYNARQPRENLRAASVLDWLDRKDLPAQRKAELAMIIGRGAIDAPLRSAWMADGLFRPRELARWLAVDVNRADARFLVLNRAMSDQDERTLFQLLESPDSLVPPFFSRLVKSNGFSLEFDMVELGAKFAQVVPGVWAAVTGISTDLELPNAERQLLAKMMVESPDVFLAPPPLSQMKILVTSKMRCRTFLGRDPDRLPIAELGVTFVLPASGGGVETEYGVLGAGEALLYLRRGYQQTEACILSAGKLDAWLRRLPPNQIVCVYDYGYDPPFSIPDDALSSLYGRPHSVLCDGYDPDEVLTHIRDFAGQSSPRRLITRAVRPVIFVYDLPSRVLDIRYLLIRFAEPREDVWIAPTVESAALAFFDEVRNLPGVVRCRNFVEFANSEDVDVLVWATIRTFESS